MLYFMYSGCVQLYTRQCFAPAPPPVFVSLYDDRLRATYRLRASWRFLGFSQLALVGHTGSLLLTELDVSVCRGLIEPPLTERTLNIV